MFSRRHVMAGALAAPFFPPGVATSQGATHEFFACYANLARLFPTSLDSARGLGRLCRSCDSEPASRAALIDALCPDSTTRALVAHGPDDAIRRWAGARIRADFAAGRVMRVDGWVLAETEIRMFSLLSVM